MRIVCISDTHTATVPIPDGDILLHAGDFTNVGAASDVIAFSNWMQSLPHKHKIAIAGNHDFCFGSPDHYRFTEDGRPHIQGFTYLEDESIVVEGLKIYGSPWQPKFCNWAFNLSSSELKDKWEEIPDDTDILITHGPPHGVMDKCNNDGSRAGCKHLATRIRDLDLKLHLFGHIHEGYGRQGIHVNASIMTLSYHPVNLPIVVDL